MKKTRFLVLALAVAVMLMGAGYAYWTDSLTIHNSIRTGILDVDFDVEANFTAEKYMDDTADTIDTTNIMQASFGVGTDGVTAGEQGANNDKLTVTVANLYPNSRYEVEGRIVNHSTIPVDINGITYTVAGLPANNADIRTNLVMQVYISDNATPLVIPIENTAAPQTLTLPTEMVKRMAETNTANDLDTMPVKVVVKLLNGAPNDTTENIQNIVLTVIPSFKQFNHAAGY